MGASRLGICFSINVKLEIIDVCVHSLMNYVLDYEARLRFFFLI